MTYMSKDNLSKIKIIFSDRNFTPAEIKEVTDSFSEILEVEQKLLLREAMGTLPAVIILVLIGEGFFRAIGSDLYKKAKEKIVKILKDKYEPTLEFRIKYKNTEIHITTKANDERTINKIFDSIANARDLVSDEMDKKETPEMTQINLGYDGSWKLLNGQNVNYNTSPKVVKFYKYNQESRKWELTKDLSNLINAYYQAKTKKS